MKKGEVLKKNVPVTPEEYVYCMVHDIFYPEAVKQKIEADDKRRIQDHLPTLPAGPCPMCQDEAMDEIVAFTCPMGEHIRETHPMAPGNRDKEFEAFRRKVCKGKPLIWVEKRTR